LYDLRAVVLVVGWHGSCFIRTEPGAGAFRDALRDEGVETMSRIPPVLTTLFMAVALGGFAPSILAETAVPETDRDLEREGQAGPGRVEDRQDRDPLADTQRGDTRPGASERERGQQTPPVGANRPSVGDPVATPDASQRMTGSAGEYVVKRGDTLAEIAQRELGDANQWKRIAQLNDIDDPKTLATGKRLQIPQRDDRGTSPQRSNAMGSDPMETGQRDSGRQEPAQRAPERAPVTP
jgi:LysM repeat protein